MKKTFSIFISFLILAGMIAFVFPLSIGISPAHAQALAQTTPTTAPAPAINTLPTESIITFGQLGLTDTFLYGPYDSMAIYFSTPNDWQLSEGAIIQLTLSPSFTPGKVPAGGEAPTYSNGILYVTYNGNASFQVGLSWTGENTYTFEIPSWAMKSSRQDGRQEIRLFLNAGTDCQDDGRTDVIVKSTSSIFLPHTYKTPDTNLAVLPKPFYLRSSFAPIPALVIIPDQPTANELQAALTTAAGFGRMTLGNLSLDLLNSSQVTVDMLSSSNLIFVGKAAVLPLLKEVALPAPNDGKQFAAKDANPDDGIVQVAVSPWNPSNVVLVVGGNSDLAVIKAAQAVSSGTLRPGSSPALTLVKDVLQSIEIASVADDRNLNDLGYSSVRLDGVGLQSTDIIFTVPAGQSANEGSYLKLDYNHSGLLDLNTSGLTVYLNGETIGSQNLSKDSASNATTQISIPADLVKQGTNALTIEVNLEPMDNCSLFAQDNLWAIFSSASLLHLPLESAATMTKPMANLGHYPYPFLSSPTLKTTTFVIPADQPAAWKTAAQIAMDLGRRSTGALVELSVVMGDAITEDVRQSQDLLIVGQASNLPVISELNPNLPAPFEAGSNLATERAFRVVYNLPPEATIGYLELLASPWQPERTILAVLGSNPDGLTMAASALTTPALRSQLGGDFAVVNGSQVLISDSRLQVGTGNISATVVPVESTPVTESPQIIQATVVPESRPLWLGPTILTTTGLILATFVGLGVVAFTRKKK